LQDLPWEILSTNYIFIIPSIEAGFRSLPI